ncbi:MAG TPA: hypothetical protein VGM42_03530 [Rhodopila sp.]|jgi:hypothetical protein
MDDSVLDATTVCILASDPGERVSDTRIYRLALDRNPNIGTPARPVPTASVVDLDTSMQHGGSLLRLPPINR